MPRARILTALLGVVTLVRAQEQPPRPTFRTESNYVRVDAYPTKNGAPIADLTREDFEVLENGQLQKIEQFERIVIGTPAPQERRIEPNTVAESRAMPESTRTRLFVLFLDWYHVDIGASRQIRRPLVQMLDQLLGPDDMIGVMTPEMSPRDIAFARKTTTIDGFLEKRWHWGERDRGNPRDPEDVEYGACYPNVDSRHPCSDQNGIAAEMIDRRHEVRTLGALEDLVRFLHGVREERKAVLTVSNGWLRFKPNPQLMRSLNCEGPPNLPGPGVDPQTAKPTVKDPNLGPTSNSCSIDRAKLAQIDDERLFRDIQDEANRANASFYTIDPRGLAVFDTPPVRLDVPGPLPPPVPVAVDSAMHRSRITALRTLAEVTDGMAMVNSNDLSSGLRRIVDDLSSYYLLGYYSSGKLDGKFHAIAVRVKQPGVQVRARRGYLAARTDEVERTARGNVAASKAPSSTAETEALSITSVLRPLRSFMNEESLRLRAAVGWKAGSQSAVWLVGELGSADVWRLGAEADATLSQDGQTLASAHIGVPPGSRHFKTLLSPPSPLQAGDYALNVRASATSQVATTSDLLPLTVPAAAVSGSLLFRKGPFTGLKEVPTADLRFRRSEQMRVEIPAAGSSSGGLARLLDRNGKAMSGVPLAVAFRDDQDGSRWATTQVPLTPLGPGDYIVEVTLGGQKTLTPFRIMQ